MTTSLELLPLHDRLLQFSSNALDFIENQPQRMAVRMLSASFVKTATAPALHYTSAQSARTKADFRLQLQIILEKIQQTKAILDILVRRHYVHTTAADALINESLELEKIFKASLRTAKREQRTKTAA